MFFLGILSPFDNTTYPSVENAANWNGIVSAVGLFSYFQYTGNIRDNRTDVIMLNMHLCQMSMRDIQCSVLNVFYSEYDHYILVFVFTVFNIGIGVTIDKASVPFQVVYVVVTFVIYQIAIEVTLEIIDRKGKQNQTKPGCK